MKFLFRSGKNGKFRSREWQNEKIISVGKKYRPAVLISSIFQYFLKRRGGHLCDIKRTDGRDGRDGKEDGRTAKREQKKKNKKK